MFQDKKIQTLKVGLKHIEWWQIVLLKVVSRISKRFHSTNRVKLVEENWDSIILLDACRFDFFEDLARKSKFPGKLCLKKSLGTDTTSFLRNNFGAVEKLDDVIYITANPFVDRLVKDKFYKVISVWKYKWNDTYNTVMPYDMYIESLKAYLKYPNKRFIIHFVQPHYPYIGCTRGKSLNLKSLREDVIKGESTYVRERFADVPGVVYLMAEYKNIERELHIACYWNNLKRVLPYALRLANILPGTTIITADHGEAFGEKYSRYIPIHVFGHAPDLYMDVLENVPWLVIPPEQKRISKLELRDLARARRILRARELHRLKKSLKKIRV